MDRLFLPHCYRRIRSNMFVVLVGPGFMRWIGGLDVSMSSSLEARW